MVYRLCRESFDSKRVREDLDWPARGTILARNGHHCLRFGLHSAKYVLQGDSRKRYRKFEYNRIREDTSWCYAGGGDRGRTKRGLRRSYYR